MHLRLPILALGRDDELYKREQAVWALRGVDIVRVATMQAAIEKLSRTDYLFVVINADCIEYMPMLKVMREMASIPIVVITSQFSIYEEVEALWNGADAYVPYQQTAEENVMRALAFLHRHSEWSKQKKHVRIQVYYDLMVFPAFRQVYCGDKEIAFTKKEFDLLLYLIINRGIALTYKQIYRKVWGNGYDEVAHNNLWNHVLRMRKKIAAATGGNGYIENVKDVGYRLPT